MHLELERQSFLHYPNPKTPAGELSWLVVKLYCSHTCHQIEYWIKVIVKSLVIIFIKTLGVMWPYQKQSQPMKVILDDFCLHCSAYRALWDSKGGHVILSIKLLKFYAGAISFFQNVFFVNLGRVNLKWNKHAMHVNATCLKVWSAVHQPKVNE